MKKAKFRKKLASLAIASGFVLNNVVFVHAAESTLWEQRRTAVEQTRRDVSQNTDEPVLQYAKLPASQIQSVLPDVSNGLNGLHGNNSPTELFSSQSAATNSQDASSNSPIPEWLLSLVNTYGQVHEIAFPPTKKADLFVIHIQDLHEAYEAQKNMAFLLEEMVSYLNTVGGRSAQGPSILVGLEGASGPFDIAPYRDFTSAPVVATTADTLLREGLLSGPEYFGLTTKTSSMLWGVEDLMTYFENVAAFKKSLPLKNADDQYVRNLQTMVSALKSELYSPRLAALDSKIDAFDNKKLGLGDYLQYLVAQNRDLNQAPNIRLFVQALELERSLDFARIDVERTQLIETLVKSLEKTDIETLVTKSLAYRIGQISYKNYYDYLKNICARHSISLDRYTQLDKYIRYILTTERIRRDALFQEMNDWVDAILANASSGAAQTQLISVNKDLKLLAKLNSFSLTHDEWNVYKERRSEVRGLAERITALATSKTPVTVGGKTALPELMERHEAFYDAAQRRNDILSSNIVKKHGEQKGRGDIGVALLIAGGFHAPGIREALLDKNVGYVSISPRVTDVKEIPHYLAPFSADRTPLEKLISGERIFLAKERMTASSVSDPLKQETLQATFSATASILTIKDLLKKSITKLLRDKLPVGETVSPDVLDPDMLKKLQQTLQLLENKAVEFSQIDGFQLDGLTIKPLGGRSYELSLSVEVDDAADKSTKWVRFVISSISGQKPDKQGVQLTAAEGGSQTHIVISQNPLSVLKKSWFVVTQVFRQKGSFLPRFKTLFSKIADRRAHSRELSKTKKILSGYYAEELDEYDKQLMPRILAEKDPVTLARLNEIRALVFQRGQELASQRMAAVPVVRTGDRIEQVKKNLERWKTWASAYAEAYVKARPEEASKLGGLDGIQREIADDIYGPLLDAVDRIGKLKANEEISPEAVQLKLSRTSANAKIELNRAARVGFLPMKGDPWQVGHVFVMLEAMASQKLDKVVIAIDNSDPVRKPNLSSLAIREGITMELMKMLEPLVEYTPVPKEEADLFTADGETMIFRLMEFNRGSNIEWNYMVGSDHRYWEKNGKPDTAQKLVNSKNIGRDGYDGETLGAIFIERAGEEFKEGELNQLAAKAGIPMSKIHQPMDTSSTRVRKDKHWWTVPMDVYEMADALRFWGAGDINDPFRSRETVNAPVAGAYHTGKISELLATQGSLLTHALNRLTMTEFSAGFSELLPFLNTLTDNMTKGESRDAELMRKILTTPQYMRPWGNREESQLRLALETMVDSVEFVKGESTDRVATCNLSRGAVTIKVRFIISDVPALKGTELSSMGTIRGPTSSDRAIEIALQSGVFELPSAMMSSLLSHEIWSAINTPDYFQDHPIKLLLFTELMNNLTQGLTADNVEGIPNIAVISDYHGEIDLFLRYIADAISQKAGKSVVLDHKVFPQKSISQQLTEQGVDIGKIDLTIYLLGDFLDRGTYGVKCYRAAEELINMGVGKYVTGNHDLWAFLNLMGYHLPIYENYEFYGHPKSQELVTTHWNDPEIANDRIGFWTAKLAEYNKAQNDLQKSTILVRNTLRVVSNIRAELKDSYYKNKEWLGGVNKSLWEDLAGYYFGNTDVSTGFNGAGHMSVEWWQNKVQAIQENLRKAREAEDRHAILYLEDLLDNTSAMADLVADRLDKALKDGKWWWQVFNDINHQNYTSVEWWGKDWSSHKGWGTSVIDELNELRGENEPQWTQANYIQNKELQSLAYFYRKNFTLFQKDPYGNVYLHAWLPVEDKTGQVRFMYKGVEYSGKRIWEGLEAIQNDVRDMGKPLSELHEALSLVNSWYADKTTKVKPEHIKTYVFSVGLKKIFGGLGIRTLFTSHNPLNKLISKGISFMVRQGDLLHFSVDKGMSWRKFEDLGGYVAIDQKGIRLRGYTDKTFQNVIDNPPTLKLDVTDDGFFLVRNTWENESLPAKEFISLMREQMQFLANEGGKLSSISSRFLKAAASFGLTESIPSLLRVINHIEKAGNMAEKLREIESLPMNVRMALLHMISTDTINLKTWSEQKVRLESTLSALVDHYESLPSESTDQALVYNITYQGKTQKVSFLLSNVPTFLQRTDMHALGTIRGPTGSGAAAEIALQETAFELDAPGSDRIISTVIKHEISELFQIIAGVNVSVAHEKALETSSLQETEEVRAAIRDFLNPRKKTYVEKNAKHLKDYTVVSLQFEAGLDRGLMDRLITLLGRKLPRFLGQLTMTGGLGALMHDLVVGWKKNGTDIIAIHPLYNDKIKGIVADMPELPPGTKLGDYLRDSRVLNKTDISFTVTLSGNEFRNKANNDKAKQAIGKEIVVDVYEGLTKFGQTPLYYMDAYYVENGEKVRIFDELYPDNDFRVVHMALYNEAAQKLVQVLQERGVVKKNLLFVENEVFVSLPKNQFPDAVRHHINHTVWKPGMYRPPEYAYDLLGFDPTMRGNVVRNGKIDVAEYVAQAADILSGVGLYEHTPVLKSGIFPLYTHKVVGYNEGGIRNTNGALLDQWQSPELRQLINLYKNKLALSDQDDDVTLFNALVRRKSYQTQFKSRLEYIKALQALDLLIWLNQFQPQAMGGGTWLETLSKEAKISTMDLINLRDRLRGQIEKALTTESNWKNVNIEFYNIKNLILKNPMVANVRRQVAYKGPDKYREMLEWFERDPEVLKQFRESGTRLIIGGRTFGKDARELFDELKQRAERLGLGDRFAFIENYNIDDAQTIFRGISGSVMLSDEFLEASATSMMKGVTNGAALIGVWGGAEPELFTITEKATGRVIDVFTSGMTHDQLVAGLKSGIYEITNGFLVEYTPSEMSKEEMGGRRPSAASLLNAFVELGRKGSSIEARQNLLYATLASSWKVDIERSQARGHIQLWEQAIKDRMAKNEFLSGLAPKPEEANDLLYKKGTGFEWKFKEFGVTEKVVFKGDVGLLGFLESFHRVRAMGDVGNWSLQFHSAIPYAKGDVLTYLDSLLEGYPSLASVRERLNEYAQQVQANQNTLDKVRITLAALDFMESVARYLASEKRETPSVFSRIWDRAKALVQRASMQKYGRWWRTPTETHRAMSVPVFSLRGNKNDVGIGKFTQLYSFYKEMYATYRIDTFHLLPHYATLSESPYAAVDVNSLNELFIDWTAVKDFEETPENLALLTDNLTDVESVDYKNVKIRERAVALTAWETFRQNELLQETDRSQDFMNFVRENASWIRNYSEFMAYVDVTGRSPLELSADDMEKAKRNEYFTESVNLHLYSQWIAEKQLSEAISAIREDGGHVLFDLPMFRGKNSVDVWKHPEYFRKSNINDPSVQNPGIVRKDSELHMGDLNEDWTDLALWNWTQLKDERFEPFFSPVRRWLNLGFDGIRIDAWHMAYPFGNGQKASGDEPGDLLMGPLAQIIQQKDALPLAEAFENLDGKAARLGFVIVGRDWKTVSTHDIERIYPSEKDLSREIAAKMNEPHSWKNAKFVSFTAGDGSMDKYYPIKIMTHINNMRQSLWRWRMPRPGVKADVWRAPTSLMVHLFNAADTFVKKVGTRVELWASSLDWFQQEWGRDAFISLPGLLLSTGRFSDARNVIKNFARHEKNGLIPNRIWDENNIEYNSADASMWYLDAIRKYIETSGNWDILKEEIRDGETLLSIVRNIVDRYAEGTSYERHNRENRIYMDDDGLIVSPAQATWMDADPDGKDHPVTPRNGKAVEINALWYSNLRFLQGIEFRMLEPTRAIALKNRADLVKKSFNDKFWFEDEANGKTWKTNGGALYDVIDGDPHKAAIRPNMIFAISHGDDLLSLDRQKSVLAAVSNDLLTPYGLRTLSPRDSNYKGTYHTDWAPRDKDQAYHQGTVWPWLIGPYVDALVKIRHAEGVPEADIQEEVKKVLDPLMTHFMTYRNNLPERFHTLPEVFDGDAPHNPGGTRSQAWSVAELLRAYKEHVFNHRGLIAKELVPAGAWHVQSARLLAEKVLPAMEKASLAMTTAGLSYLPQAIRWYQSAVNEGGQAWQNYVGKVKQLPSQIRYFILHEVAGLKEHRRPLSRQDQERLLSSLDQPGMVMNVVSRSDDGLVLDVTPAGESPVRMSFFSSDVPSFYATPDIHALATLKGDDQGVYEVSLQKILFDLSPQVLQTVLKHELREISLLRTGKNPMEAHRQVVEEQGSETIDGVVSALSDHLMKGSIQSLQNMIRANPPTQGVNANIKLPDLFPLPISRPDYLKELIIDVRLSPTTEQEMTQMSLTRVIQGEPGLSSAVFFQGHIEKTLRSGVNLSAVVDRQTLGQKLSEMNAQQRMNLLNSLKTMTDNLSQNKASADDVASFVLELITKAGREEGQIATTTPSPTAAQVQSLNRRFETTAGMIIAVLKQADISVDETFVKTLASVYVQAFQQGRQHLSPLTDADVFLSRKAPDVSGLSVGLFHIPSIRPEILNTHPEIKQTLDKFVQMLRNTDPNAFAAEFLLDDPFETVSPEKAKSQIVDLLSSMVPDDLRDRFNAVRSRIYVMTTPSLPAQALIENRLDLDVIFETIQNSHLSGLGSIGQIQIFTTQPKRFREAWRAKFAWMLYLVLPEGLMVEATRNIDGALKAIQFIETQA